MDLISKNPWKKVKIKSVLILLAIFYMGAVVMYPQIRWALLVGINKNEPKAPSLNKSFYHTLNNLYDFINDVDGMKGILISRFGFKTESIHLLINEDASRERTLSELKKYFIQEALPARSEEL